MGSLLINLEPDDNHRIYPVRIRIKQARYYCQYINRANLELVKKIEYIQKYVICYYKTLHQDGSQGFS